MALARGISDAPAEYFSSGARPAKTRPLAAAKAFGAEGIVRQQFSEAASGQVVFHLHMHIMPMRAGVELLPPQTRMEDPTVLEEHAAKMISALRE